MPFELSVQSREVICLKFAANFIDSEGPPRHAATQPPGSPGFTSGAG
jgi:hypothetical protein